MGHYFVQSAGLKRSALDTKPTTPTEVVLAPRLADDKKCENCGLTNFAYINCGALVRRQCLTKGCEHVMNGQVANDIRLNPFIAATCSKCNSPKGKWCSNTACPESCPVNG